MSKRAELIASEGMILTDGEIYARRVLLAVGADEGKFYEITEEEYEEMMKQIEVEE